ncbi:hypothetical protein [Pseudohongiella sp. O18]|uniref:hypothetical protein n=1 Tax=Pseudohongiella sp. O18 TaxID=2904248 RepID=UPI001F2C58F7|nr:hypothetical protein [Pseudohongiella sp. O18]
MKKFFEYFFFLELKSAASKNFRVNLTVMFIGCLGMSLLSIFVLADSGFGLLFAGLAFWHRYVMLKVSKVYLDAMPAGSDDHGSDAGGTSNQ